MVENAVRDHFDNWLAADTKSAGAILDFLVLRAEERLRRRQEKETARKTATKKLRLPGKLVDCSATDREGTELFIVEGDSAGGSAKMARDRKTQALLPLRGKILNVLGAASSKLGTNAEISDLCQALGVGMGTKFHVDDLRYDKIIIMTDADVDGAHIAALLMTFFFTQMRPADRPGPPLPRLPAALPADPGGASGSMSPTTPRKTRWMDKGLGGKGKIDVQRFKGLGEMDAKDLKDTTMNPDDPQADPRHHRRGRTGRDRRPRRAADGEKAGAAVPVHPGKRAVRGGAGRVRFGPSLRCPEGCPEGWANSDGGQGVDFVGVSGNWAKGGRGWRTT